MLQDYLNSLRCVRLEEKWDYADILASWKDRRPHTALMPAVFWYGGTFNLFDQKAGPEGKNLIWLVPAGQHGFFWLPKLKQLVTAFYADDEIDLPDYSHFPGIETEEFEECILLHSDDLQNDPSRTVLGANVILVRLSLSGGGEALVFLLLDHQDMCWKNIIEAYRVPLTWFVDSGRGTDDYYVRVPLYQMMKHTTVPEILPPLYFKGLMNKGEIPDGFQFRYAMLSEPNADGYDPWRTYSAVYDAHWQN